jgi:hypothetical protein
MPIELHAFDTPNGRKISVVQQQRPRYNVVLADFPNVRRRHETMMARAGVRRGFAARLG